MFLNTLLLMDVAFLPFATAVMARTLRIGEHEQVGAALYGLTLALGGIPFNLIWWWARRRHLLGSTISPDAAAALARRFWLGPILYAAATLVALVSPYAAIVIFAGMIVFYWLEPLRPTRTGARRPTP